MSKPSRTDGRPHKSALKSKAICSGRSYREMLVDMLHEAPGQALELRGIFDIVEERLSETQNQKNISINWRNSIRHCLSINDCFVRIKAAPEWRVPKGATSMWTTTDIIAQNNWAHLIQKAGLNMRKAWSSQLLSVPGPHKTPIMQKRQLLRPLGGTSTDAGYVPLCPKNEQQQQQPEMPPCPQSPSGFISVNEDYFAQSISSPLARDVADQSALFNIALIEAEDRCRGTPYGLANPVPLSYTTPHHARSLFPVLSTEPVLLPSPLRTGQSAGTRREGQVPRRKPSPNPEKTFIALPPIFNHSL